MKAVSVADTCEESFDEESTLEASTKASSSADKADSLQGSRRLAIAVIIIVAASLFTAAMFVRKHAMEKTIHGQDQATVPSPEQPVQPSQQPSTEQEDNIFNESWILHFTSGGGTLSPVAPRGNPRPSAPVTSPPSAAPVNPRTPVAWPVDVTSLVLTSSPTSTPTATPPTAKPTYPPCPSYPRPPPLPGKKGIGLSLRSPGEKGDYLQHMPLVDKLNVHWNYAWSSRFAPNQLPNVEYVPMTWGANPKRLQELVHQDFSKATRFMGYNEPDSHKQSNVPVDVALERWHFLEALNLPLVSPTTVHMDNQWMQNFMHGALMQCLRIDFVGAHWYGPPNVKGLQRKLTKLHNMYGKPIILKEFAVADWKATTLEENRFSPKSVLKFMKEALAWLEKTEWIEGYAWFPFQLDRKEGWTSALFDLDGNLTELGSYYSSVY